MMFEGKHIHFSPVDKKPLCSYSTKLCKQRRINGYAFCIRHILEDKSAPFKQCAHVARYNKQKCTNPIPSNENREFCNSHMQVAGMLPKKERKSKKEKELYVSCDGKLKFADRLRALLKKENSISCNDDPFNSDDPYAFPDSISEQENGCIGFSATPILRNAWNCSQKICSDSASDLPLKCDQPSKNSISFDGKVKSCSPKLSKTVNRLHAKIAQNKILDKQKKTQDSSQSNVAVVNSIFHSVSNIKTEPFSPVEVASVSNESNILQIQDEMKTAADVKVEPQSEDDTQTAEILSTSSDNVHSFTCVDQTPKVNSCSSPPSSHQEYSPILSNDSSDERTLICSIKAEEKCVSQPASNKIPLALQKLNMVLNNRRKDSDLFPLGFETSESEESDSEDESYLLSQISSFSVRTRSSLSSLQNKSSSRYLKKLRLKSELKQSYQQLCRLHALHTQEDKYHRDVIQPLINASRVCPNQATEVLLDHMGFPSRKIEKLQHERKKKCSYNQVDGTCDKVALPYAWHCQKHIMCNTDQLLFQHCTAKYPDNTQCSVPVFDVCHELPLCDEHAKKRDNYQKMTLEPKPKKPRKKPKLSALTRAPKRGKKKKRSNPLRPASPIHSLLPPPSNASNSTTSHVSSQLSFDNATLKSVQAVLQTAEMTRDLNGEVDSELGSDIEEQFSPGAIDKSLELPLDAAELANQATKLLEEHDFSEVLNKLPDDAFNDLFVEGRNGDYIPIPNEELERALAAVSKDVHLSNVSLAKLSSNTGPDLEELERSIDIHSSLLGAENLTSAIDENAFPELNNSLNVITSSFSSSDLNSFTQALSNIAAENIDQNHLPAVSDSHLIQNSVATVPLLTSDVTHSHVLNGHTSVGLPPLNVDSNFATHLLDNGLNSAMHEGPGDGRFLGNSHLANILFGLGQASATSLPQTTFANGSNISEDTGLLSTQGGLTSTHWLLNSSDQVLALSHMPYQNGFVVSSQSVSPYTSSPLLASVGKYPLQAMSAEVSLVSSSSPLVTSSSSESVTCGNTEPAVPNMNLSSRPVSLQQNGSATVIVQEGAS